MENIKFSIMTPVYNVAEYLPECLDSVINQSYKNYELILVDDGSTDESGRICDEYAARDSRIRVFHKPNGGLFHTRRFALERITGDYCVFLDSDDYIALNTLEALAGYIGQTHADCVIYGCRWLKPTGTVEVLCADSLAGKLVTDKRELYNVIFNDAAYNAIWRKCVKSTVFDGRDYSRDYHIKNGEDIVQTIEIVENSRSVLFVRDMLYYYRVNPTSITHTNKYAGYRADFDVEERILAFLKRSDAWTQDDFDRYRNRKLDELVILIKHICHSDASIPEKAKSIESIREHETYTEYFENGYNAVPAIPGTELTGKPGRYYNKMIIRLINTRRYKAAARITTFIYRAAKAVGSRQ